MRKKKKPKIIYIVWIDNNEYGNDDCIHTVTSSYAEALSTFEDLYRQYFNDADDPNHLLPIEDIPSEGIYDKIIDDNNTYLKLIKYTL